MSWSRFTTTLAVLPVVLTLSRGDIILNELHYDPDVKVEPVEFVELFNRGTGTVDLSGWSLADGVTYSFPPGTAIGPAQYVVVGQDPSAVSNKFGTVPLGPFSGRLGNDGERISLLDEAGRRVDRVEYGSGFPWPTVGDAPGPSLQLVHPDLDNDLGGSWRSGTPSPAAQNTVFLSTNTIPPQIRQVRHDPKKPLSGDVIKITAKVTDPDGVASVTLHYQVVDPGSYIALTDTVYQTSWSNAVMNDDGLAGDDQPGDTVYTLTVPASFQAHRRLVRYRITVEDSLANSLRVPYSDDPQPNFAYFVYDGVPAWSGGIRTNSPDPELSEIVEYGTNVMRSLPVYHLIAKRADIEDCVWYSEYDGNAYPWYGSLVYDGEVHDHVTFRLRGGGSSRYKQGKEKFKIDFKRGHWLQARDDYGREYGVTWDKLNLSACIQTPATGHRGEQGMFEAAAFRLFELAGTPAPRTHWLHLRVIDEIDEAPADQYRGDFWGLHMAIEQLDGRFLDEHDLPDGNLYKMINNNGAPTSGELNNQGPTQPTDGSDLAAFAGAYKQFKDGAWWLAHARVDRYFGFRTIVDGIHHYDMGGKNYFYYHNPESDLWTFIPWDTDLTWANGMYVDWSSTVTASLPFPVVEPFMQYGGDGTKVNAAWLETALSIRRKNRIRELRDLLFNSNEAYRLLDELAAVIDPPHDPLTIVAADRALWDYHPIMFTKGGDGTFYQLSATDDFRGMVQNMKNYISSRVVSLDGQAADADIPDTPTISVSSGTPPINDVRLTCSAFADPQGSNTFSALSWRVGEITDTNSPVFDPDAPWAYEIQSVWESGELSAFTNAVGVPASVLRVGHRYRGRVRMKDDTGRWSHWSEPAEFVPGDPDNALALSQHLRLMELMYDPPDGQEWEFVELQNTSSNFSLSLDGVTFADGIDFSFTTNTVLGPLAHVLVVRSDPTNAFASFRARYGLDPSVMIRGPYGGILRNGGETIRVAAAPGGEPLVSFTYSDDRGWPLAADGGGHSLVPAVVDSQAAGELSYGGNWRPSAFLGGSPGHADPDPIRDIVLNEFMAHTDYTNDALPEYESNDWIELYSLSTVSRTLTNWYLSDDIMDLRKWGIPGTNVIAADGWITFDEVTGFHAPITQGFGLDKAGEQLILSYLPGTASNRIADCVRFMAQENATTEGYAPDGSDYWYALVPTTNQANEAPGPRPVISEVMYHPAPTAEHPESNTHDEFVEILNPTGSALPLWNASGSWSLAGSVEYWFPTNTLLPAGERLVVVPFDPGHAPARESFLGAYGLTNGQVRLFGPWFGELPDTVGRVTLVKPDAPDTPGPPLDIRVDEAIYFHQSPWPTGADGSGLALQRISTLQSGNDPANWKVGLVPSPGSVEPKIAISSPAQGSEFILPFTTRITTTVDLSRVQGSIHGVECFKDFVSIGTDSTPPYEWTASCDPPASNVTFTVELVDDAGAHPSMAVVLNTMWLDLAGGASDVTESAARLNGRVNGGGSLSATFFLGAGDGVEDPEAWEQAVPAGSVSGLFWADASTLNPDQVYYYRCYGTNANGDAWSQQASSFRTSLFTDWTHRMTIAFDGYGGSETLRDFPALVVLSTNIAGFSYPQVGSSAAADLRFVGGSDNSTLSYDIDTWDTNGSSFVWVRIPEVSPSGTYIWMYWGNTNAKQPAFALDGSAWSAGYRAVWHLDGTTTDATSNRSVAVDNGSGATTGMIGDGRLLDGATSTIDPAIGTNWYASAITNLTLSLWARPDVSANMTVFGANDGGSAGELTMSMVGRRDEWKFEVDSTPNSEHEFQLGQWQLLSLVLNSGTARAYLNTNPAPSDMAYTAYVPGDDPVLGGLRNLSGVSAFFNGAVDELRISAVPRSPDWVRAEYRTVANSSGFASYEVDGTGAVPLWWKMKHFGGTNSVDSGDSEDPDGDGLVNRDEYVAGTDPTNGLNTFDLTIVLSNAPPAVGFYSIAASSAYFGKDRLYSLEQTTNLVTSAWQTMDGYTNIPGSDAWVWHTNTLPSDPAFFRGSVRLE